MLSVHSYQVERVKENAMHWWWAFTPPVWCEYGGCFHAIIFTECSFHFSASQLVLFWITKTKTKIYFSYT